MVKKNALQIYRKLKSKYPKAHCTLRFRSRIQLLVATILSAQSTDKMINQITPSLFKRYKTVKDFADADLRTLQNLVKSSGFYRQKAKNIKAACQKMVKDYNGKVPDTMEKLTSLPGVARKTANVVLNEGFGKSEGVVVDTHIGRVSQRLGFTKHKDPKKIEQDLIKQFPKRSWRLLGHVLIFHGRQVCKAPKPLCPKCPVKNLCPSAKKYYRDLSV